VDDLLDDLRLGCRRSRYFLPRRWRPRPIQHLLETPNLVEVLSNERVFRILVDSRPVLDAFGAVGVAQRAQRFVIVVVGRRQAGDHQRLGVAAERVLQKPGEFRVAIRNVRRASVDQRRYDVAERRQRQINLGRLFETVPHRARLALPLAPGQVDQVELRRADFRSAGRVVAAFQMNREDGMTSRRDGVHRRRPGRAVLPAAVHHHLARGHARHRVHRQVFDEDVTVRPLSQFQTRFRILAQKVAHLLVVDLQKRGVDEVARFFGDGNRVENLVESARDESPLSGRIHNSLHGEGLSAAGLAVRKHRSIVAFGHALDQRKCDVQVDLRSTKEVHLPA